jgi:hypothetical protein
MKNMLYVAEFCWKWSFLRMCTQTKFCPTSHKTINMDGINMDGMKEEANLV